MIKSLLKCIPSIKKLIDDSNALRRINPGHFYSPIPSEQDIHRHKTWMSIPSDQNLPGIDLNVEGQLRLIENFKPFYDELPFRDDPTEGSRYYFNNEYYPYSDAICLYCMMRHAQPSRIIEIGSGFSSFAMLDTNELFFDNRIRLTFVEPYPDRLQSRLNQKDTQSCTILSKPVQDVELTLFEELGPGDILFVDSSHVGKVGSDVNHILFEIVPRLSKEVYIHFHDVFFPFEYPKQWINEGRYWNEDYMLRCFLLFNTSFKMILWNQFLGVCHADKLKACMPLCLKNKGGSLWLQRI